MALKTTSPRKVRSELLGFRRSVRSPDDSPAGGTLHAVTGAIMVAFIRPRGVFPSQWIELSHP